MFNKFASDQDPLKDARANLNVMSLEKRGSRKLMTHELNELTKYVGLRDAQSACQSRLNLLCHISFPPGSQTQIRDVLHLQKK